MSMKGFAWATKSINAFLAMLVAVSVVAAPSLGITGTTTTLAITPDSSVVAGTAVTLTATVTRAGAPITAGSVTFCNFASACSGPGVLGVAQVTSSGTAALKLVLGVGTYNVQAQFNGLNGAWQSNSGQQTLTVTGNSTYQSSTTMTPTGSAGTYTLAATITAFGRPAPSGTVSFNDASNANYVLATAAPDPSTLNFSLTPATGSPLNVGMGSYFVATGDFNGDGIPDMAIADTWNVSIFLGKGDGTFQNPTTNVTGASPGAIVVGDFNSDGVQDLAIANYGGNTLSILLGNGDGTFQSQVTYTVGNAPESVEMADVNWDGIQDLVVANANDNDISVLLGNGDGTFQAQSTYSTGNEPRKLALVDFNGDGFPDIVTANGGDNDVTVLLGNGDGTFGSPQAFPAGANPNSVETGDFNGDGIADLVVGHYTGSSINVLLGNGDGTFQPQVPYATGVTPLHTVVGDFSGDNLLDVAVSNATDNTVSLLLGKGDGTFQPQVVYAVGTTPIALAAADFNGDGLLDLAAPNFADGTMSVLLGQQSITATANNVNVPGSGMHNVVASYPGDASRAASQSSAAALAGGPAIATATSLLSSVNPVPLGQTVEFTAIVNPIPAGASFGAVSFYDGASLLGSNTVNASGVATFAASNFALGTHTVTAVYSGNASFAGSTSPALIETVAKPGLTATVTSLSGSPNPATSGQSVTLTAIVNPAPTGASAGTVDFYNGSTQLAAVSLDTSGVTSYVTSALPVGTNHLTAVYSGNSAFEGSTSPSVAETVSSSPVFTVTAPASITITAGTSTNVSVTITPVGGAYDGVVTMSNSALPAGLTATWSPEAVTPKSKSVITTMTISAPSTTSDNRRNNQSKFPIGSAGMAVGMCLVFGRRKRFEQGLRMVLVFTVLYSGMMLTGCAGGLGTSSTPTPQSQSYQVTITGTSGSLHSSTTVTLIVKQ